MNGEAMNALAEPEGYLTEWGAEDLRPLQRRPDQKIGVFRLRAGAVRHLLQPSGLEGWTDERQADRDELAARGWTNEDGEPTAKAVELDRQLRAHGDVLHLSAADASGVVQGWIHCGADQAVVIVGPTQRPSNVAQNPFSRQGGLPEPQADVMVDVVSLDAVPLLLARWGGLSPAWSDLEPLTLVDTDVLSRRVADASEPALPEADADLARLWERPWTWWSVATASREVDLQYINAADCGQFMPRRNDDGTTALMARPCNLVWGDLQVVCRRLPSRSDEDW
ncbi:hypothetical protein [Gephyromycinifex aptenodytis]|uniref:hypothetical protein n=1 Tax=Gephyromycinifex aptenodytis TaxID=2716227 RepID=UPI001446A397|nr:hypothetical protein [Gephyromycinifex aptenodytis]